MTATTQINVHAETVTIATQTLGDPEFKILRIKVKTREGVTDIDVFLPDGYMPEISADLIEAAEGVAA
jgi:hypothetical protein